MTEYFHVAPSDLPLGELLPGHFGRLIRAFSKEGRSLADLGDAKVLTWESCLELARRLKAPHAPSRLNCTFACFSEKDATTFRDRFRQGWAIFQVATIDEPAIHLGNYDLITVGTADPFVDYWVDRAIRYWQEAPRDGAMVEVLIGGPVTVLRRL
jgi:hypothetical protein